LIVQLQPAHDFSAGAPKEFDGLGSDVLAPGIEVDWVPEPVFRHFRKAIALHVLTLAFRLFSVRAFLCLSCLALLPTPLIKLGYGLFEFSLDPTLLLGSILLRTRS
jgi:hypothetical protein